MCTGLVYSKQHDTQHEYLDFKKRNNDSRHDKCRMLLSRTCTISSLTIIISMKRFSLFFVLVLLALSMLLLETGNNILSDKTSVSFFLPSSLQDNSSEYDFDSSQQQSKFIIQRMSHHMLHIPGNKIPGLTSAFHMHFH